MQNEQALGREVATLRALEQRGAQLLEHVRLWAKACATCRRLSTDAKQRDSGTTRMIKSDPRVTQGLPDLKRPQTPLSAR